MQTHHLLLIAGPIGYIALTAYLLSRVIPLPIAVLPIAAPEDERVRQPVAA